jgi:transcription elongation factor Elf1
MDNALLKKAKFAYPEAIGGSWNPCDADDLTSEYSKQIGGYLATKDAPDRVRGFIENTLLKKKAKRYKGQPEAKGFDNPAGASKSFEGYHPEARPHTEGFFYRPGGEAEGFFPQRKPPITPKPQLASVKVGQRRSQASSLTPKETAQLNQKLKDEHALNQRMDDHIETKKCEGCGEMFSGNRNSGDYCCYEHSDGHWHGAPEGAGAERIASVKTALETSFGDENEQQRNDDLGLHVFNPDYNLTCNDCGYGELMGDHGIIASRGKELVFESEEARELYRFAYELTGNEFYPPSEEGAQAEREEQEYQVPDKKLETPQFSEGDKISLHGLGVEGSLKLAWDRSRSSGWITFEENRYSFSKAASEAVRGALSPIMMQVNQKLNRIHIPKKASAHEAAVKEIAKTVSASNCELDKMSSLAKKAAAATHVLYDACPTSYTVRVMKGNNTIDEYNGGNAPFDSTSVINRTDSDAIEYKRLLDYAERTAKEMAEEYGVPEKMVEHDDDLLAEEREAAGMDFTMEDKDELRFFGINPDGDVSEVDQHKKDVKKFDSKFLKERSIKGAVKPKCPHCGSSKYSLMPTDFETAKCDECGKNWNHGIVKGINDPYEKLAGSKLKLKWKIDPPPTGRFRSFQTRGWPSAHYLDGNPAIHLFCDEEYSGRTAKANGLEIRIQVADWSAPSNKETGSGFTWRQMKQRGTSLTDARAKAEAILAAHPEIWPKEEEPKTAARNSQFTMLDPKSRFLWIMNPQGKVFELWGKEGDHHNFYPEGVDFSELKAEKFTAEWWDQVRELEKKERNKRHPVTGLTYQTYGEDPRGYADITEGQVVLSPSAALRNPQVPPQVVAYYKKEYPKSRIVIEKAKTYGEKRKRRA